LFFLHGVGSDKAVWDEQLTHFGARGYRAVALDYPRLRRIRFAASDPDRARIASYIFAALDELKITTAHVVGLSMGGVIALEMWRQQPARLRSLVLADTFANHPEGDAILQRSLDGMTRLGMREFAEGRVGAVLQPRSRAGTQTARRRKYGAHQHALLHVGVGAVWTADYVADLTNISTPALVVVGEHDGLTPVALSEKLHKGIRNSRLEIIPAAGHLANLDNPAAFNEALAEFFQSV
jgi:3-oxoadipate enol-lactonase